MNFTIDHAFDFGGSEIGQESAARVEIGC